MLLVIAYSQPARQALRNLCHAHERLVVERYGRAVLLSATELAALHALRLRVEFEPAIQVEQTKPFNEYSGVRATVREAAHAYANRDRPETPYAKFAAGTDYPDQGELAGREL